MEQLIKLRALVTHMYFTDCHEVSSVCSTLLSNSLPQKESTLVREYFSNELMDSGVAVQGKRISFGEYRFAKSRVSYNNLITGKPVEKRKYKYRKKTRMHSNKHHIPSATVTSCCWEDTECKN